jgi:hypothetical protein
MATAKAAVNEMNNSELQATAEETCVAHLDVKYHSVLRMTEESHDAWCLG